MEPLRGEEETAASRERAFVSTGREIEPVADGAVLDAVDEPTVAWSGPDWTAITGGAAATLTASGAGRFEAIQRAAAALFAGRTVESTVPRVARPRLFGGFAFHVDSRQERDETWADFPDAQFVLPAMQVVTTEETTWLVANATGPNADRRATERLDTWAERLASLDADRRTTADPPGISARRFTPEKDGWRAQIRAAVERIERGDLEKVVLAQAQTVDLDEALSVSAAYERLGETYPDCYRFVVTPEGGDAFFGATPETLVARDGRTVRTTALAGSTGRGDTPTEDEWLARELQSSEKDSHEHTLVVEAIKDQLDPYATTISTGDRTVRKLASVQHLQTPISADLAEDDHVLRLVEALHPTPAVGGLPPEAAWETIRETEAFDRGWYASPVGWFDAEGNGTFAVAIRSAVANGEQATLFAGNGIVADSDPDREWDEVQLKYSPILNTLEAE